MLPCATVTNLKPHSKTTRKPEPHKSKKVHQEKAKLRTNLSRKSKKMIAKQSRQDKNKEEEALETPPYPYPTPAKMTTMRPSSTPRKKHSSHIVKEQTTLKLKLKFMRS